VPRLQQKTKSEVQRDIINAVVARTSLSDVTDASALKHLISGVAISIADVYFQFTALADLFDFSRAAGADLDERAKEVFGATITRNGARRGVGVLQFSRSVASGAPISIPIGTTVRTAAGITVETIEAATIDAGQTNTASSASGDPTARAVIPGADGNIAANTAKIFGSQPAGVDTVNNGTGFTAGRDQETDDEFRQRLLSVVAALPRSTVLSLEQATLGVTDGQKVVQFARVFEDPNVPGTAELYIDDGAGTAKAVTVVAVPEVVTTGLAGPPPNTAVGGEEFLYLDNKPIDETAAIVIEVNGVALTRGTDYELNPASGLLYFSSPLLSGASVTATYTYYTGLVAVVQKIIDGDPDDRLNFAGYRAGGVLVRVLTPSTRSTDVTATLVLTQGTTRATATSAAITEVSNYINDLDIGADVIRNEIVERIMSVVGVIDVNLIIPACNTNRIAVADFEIARTGTVTIT
jgi:uncharacterized phage protein gp47/JayE